MLNGLSTSTASHIRTVKLCDITVWQAAGTAGKGRTTHASPTKDEEDDEVSQRYKLLSEERAQVPQVPNPQQQNRKVTKVTEVTPSYAAAPATKLIV